MAKPGRAAVGAEGEKPGRDPAGEEVAELGIVDGAAEEGKRLISD